MSRHLAADQARGTGDEECFLTHRAESVSVLGAVGTSIAKRPSRTVACVVVRFVRIQQGDPGLPLPRLTAQTDRPAGRPPHEEPADHWPSDVTPRTLS